MTVQPSPARKTPWLAIGLGALAALCLCAVVAGVAIYVFFTPASVSTSAVPTAVNEIPTEIVIPQDTAEPATVPAEETPQSANPLSGEAAPVGSAVDLGNNVTLTVLSVTRPADDIVANGSSFNTTPAEGEEFMRVDVEVACNSDSTCNFYPTVTKAVLSDGSTRDLQTFIEGVDDWDTSLEIEAGATQQGFLLFLVPKSESEIVLKYQDIYDDQPIYFQLP